LDQLYRKHPDDFVAARHQLATDLRAAANRDEADAVRKLRRPSVAAWLLNRTALEAPRDLQRFDEASRQLQAAQSAALEGRDRGAGLREAAARERDASRALVDAAEKIAREAGHPPSARALELVRETLRAAAADPELRERITRGRLEREQSAATLGGAPSGPVKRRTRSKNRREATEARRELKQLERELAAAGEREDRLRDRIEQVQKALHDEKARLADAKKETADLRRRVKAADRSSTGRATIVRAPRAQP